jgi:hypothetical protein
MPRLLVALLFAANALAAGRAIAPSPLIAANAGGSPAVAEAGGRFLTAWVESAEIDSQRVMGALTDGRGARIGPPFFIAEVPQHAWRVDVAGTGDSFALFAPNSQGVTQMIDIALNGRVLRTRVLDFEKHALLRVWWNGKQFFIAASNVDTPGFSALLSRDGEVLHDGVAINGELVEEVLARPDGFLVFTNGDTTSAAHLLAEDGSITTTTPLDYWANQIHAATLPNGDVLIVWVSPGCPDYGLLTSVWRNGAISTQKIPHGRFMRPLRVMPRTGDRHLVAFEERIDDRDVLGTMFVGSDGMPQSELSIAEGVAFNQFTQHDSASNGARFFFAYRERGLFGVAIERDGTLRTPVALSVEPAEQSPPLIRAAGGRMLAVWHEADEDGPRIRAAAIGPSLETQSDHEILPGGIVDMNRAHQLGFGEVQRLAGNGSEALAVIRPRHGLIAQRIRADGSPDGPAIELWPDTPTNFAVAWAGDRWAVVWTRDLYLWIATVTSDGVASPYRMIQRNTPPVDPIVRIHVGDVALAFDGSDLHVTWIESHDYVDSMIFTTRVSTDGVPRDEHALRIHGGASSIATTASDDTLLVLIDEYWRTTAAAIDRSRVVTSQRIYDWPARSDVTWDGSAFIAALRPAGKRWYALALRLGKDARVLDSRGIATLAPRSSNVLSVAAAPEFGVVLGMQASDPLTDARAVLYTEDDLSPLPPPPLPPTNLRRTWYALEWDDTAEAYAVERLNDDGSIQTIATTTEPRLLYPPERVRVRAFDGGVVSAPTDWIAPRRRPSRN